MSRVPARGAAPPSQELREALLACRDAFVPVAIFSMFINLLMFVSPLYMLQVYDRVLSSGSQPTLAALTVIAFIALACFGLFEIVRSRLLVRAGIKFDALMGERVFGAVYRANIVRGGEMGTAQSVRDLDQIREFLTGGGLIAFFDAPWVPIFVIVTFLMHPWLGALSLAGVIIIFLLALANEMTTRKPLTEASTRNVRANYFISNSTRNAEVINAMGMLQPVMARWRQLHHQALGLQAVASDNAGAVMGAQKAIRFGLQVGILGLGALLVLDNQMTAGVMIAASIIMGRALAPVEMAVGQWKNFVNARTAYTRLQALLSAIPSDVQRLSLPAPEGHLEFNQVLAGAPGRQELILRGVSFTVRPGQIMGVIGPSGAGKSTLARVVTGVWPVLSGEAKLDGSELRHWNPEELGQFMGYLPQDVELFDGTVAENISRFQAADDSTSIIEAAKLAGVHEMIANLPQGYNTPIGVGGQALSGGQRQRIALARALFRMPPLIVLDEPNSNLDSEGEQALAQALVTLRDQGKTVVVITHRPALLNSVDEILVMRDGRVETLGPRDDVLSKFARPNVVPMQGGKG